MKVYHNFDADACLEIAKRSGVKQTEKDVAYTKFLAFHNPKKYTFFAMITAGFLELLVVRSSVSLEWQ